MAGLVTFNIEDNNCEVVSIDSFLPTCGVGSKLLSTVVEHARTQRCNRLWLVTTNDNLEALKFYQRRGMRISAIYPGAMDRARAEIKPQIPLLGEHGIPIRDEIELEISLYAG